MRSRPAFGLLAWGALSVPLFAQATERMSVSTAGVQGNNDSYMPVVSADGRFVAFCSYASNMDASSASGVFVRDRQLGLTERVSVDSAGTPVNGFYWRIAISADGRFAAFETDAANLVPNDTNGTWDVFVHDRQTGVTERASTDSAGLESNGPSHQPSLSPDGRFVAFYSSATNLAPGDANLVDDVFVHDRQTGLTERVSLGQGGAEGNNLSRWPSISADGRFVAFESSASNLVSWDANPWTDVFVRDRLNGTTELVSVSSTGVQGDNVSGFPSISPDGRYVTFSSNASNLGAR